MYAHLLIPTDGSPLSTVALEKALAFARDAGAKVTVLTVVEPFHLLTMDPEEIEATRSEFERYAAEEAARWLTDAQLKAKALGVPCEALQVMSDEPFRAIIDTADGHECDLIAMASHGRHGIAAVLLGSVTAKVLAHSKIPILVYRE